MVNASPNERAFEKTCICIHTQNVNVSVELSIYIAHKRETSTALYALVRSKQTFSHVAYMYLGQQQDHAGSPAKNFTPMDQP